jgi:hypothetical protein
MDGFLVISLDWGVLLSCWMTGEALYCSAALKKGSGAPNKSNYALSWIGMANTKFLLDLYEQGINTLSYIFSSAYMVLRGANREGSIVR